MNPDNKSLPRSIRKLLFHLPGVVVTVVCIKDIYLQASGFEPAVGVTEDSVAGPGRGAEKRPAWQTSGLAVAQVVEEFDGPDLAWLDCAAEGSGVLAKILDEKVSFDGWASGGSSAEKWAVEISAES